MQRCYIDSQVGKVEIVQEIVIPRIPIAGEFLRLHTEPEYEREVLRVTFIQQSDFTWTPCVDLGGIEVVQRGKQ